MTSNTNRLLLGLFAVIPLVVLLSFASCKQGEGEICQINSDCSSGLVCNAATGKCQEVGGPTIDAAPIDAALPDATPPDATPDASPDAAPDAS